MARRSAKPTPTSALRSSSKRAAAETPSRRSKRAKAAAKDAYIEPDSDEDAVPTEPASDAEDFQDEDFEDEGEGDKEITSESDHGDLSGEEEAPAKKGRGRPAKRTELPLHKKMASEQELWKPGAKLEPGTTLVIKKPKAREAGDTPYTEDTIPCPRRLTAVPLR